MRSETVQLVGWQRSSTVNHCCKSPAPPSSLPCPRPPCAPGASSSEGLGVRRSNSWEKATSLGTSENSRTLLVQVWPDDLQSKNHLGPSETCRISVPTSDPLN